jgi:hypothetical protein
MFVAPRDSRSRLRRRPNVLNRAPLAHRKLTGCASATLVG